MKFSILPADLSAALDVASKAVARRGETRALEGVLIEALADGSGSLRVSGTDLERRAWHVVSARVDQAGSVVLPPKPIQEFVSNVSSDDTIEITVSDTHRATLVSGATRVKVAGFDPESFPPALDLDSPIVDFTMAAGEFATLLRHTIHAVAKGGASKVVLEGVMLSNLDGPLMARASDSYHAAMDGVDVETDGEFNVSATARGLAECIKPLMAATSVRIVIVANASGKPSSLVVDCEGGSWSTRLIDGVIPDMSRFLSVETTCTVTVNRDALERAIKLVRGVEEGNSKGVYRFHLGVTADGLEFWAGDDSMLLEARTSVAATVVGEPIPPMQFTSSYFADAVSVIDSTDIVIEASHAPRTPVIVRPSGERGRHCQVLIPLVMPRVAP